MYYKNARVGIDIGGTKIRWIYLQHGRYRAEKEIQTPRTRAHFIRLLQTLFFSFHTRGVRHIGIGIAGVVSDTTLLESPNLPHLRNLNFSCIAPPNVSLRIDNDARCFARAEATYGHLFHTDSGLTVIFGTGIGRAVSRKGKIIPITQLMFPESWESEYQERRKHNPSSLAPFLGEKIVALISKYKPHTLILGGGTLRERHLFHTLQRELRKRGVHIPIYYSRFRKNSGALGAALLFST
ncbi:MAG: ROK family protein [Patescibacteria group bacterium]|nr:ROK family protein [Patescibacteria group bacterium]